ncbi:MAG: type IX secretion system sortase PorU [Saprospiraceae bacterium]|nr:type IX secretion system sortase PorU [Saprospiraceae bacterium]
MGKLLYTYLFIILIASVASAQNFTVSKRINWADEPDSIKIDEENYIYVWSFENGNYSPDFPDLPSVSERIEVGRYTYKAELRYSETSAIDLSLQPESALQVADSIYIDVMLVRDKGLFFLAYQFLPIFKQGNSFVKLDTFTIDFIVTGEWEGNIGTPKKTNSVLNNGTFFKMAVAEYGIHKIDYDQLKKIGIDPDRINPAHIKIYSDGSGMLAESNDIDRVDDTEEIPIFVTGEADGKFDKGDLILFFAQGPDELKALNSEKRMSFVKNLYDVRNHYFINAESTNGKRVAPASQAQNGSYISDTFDDVIRLEEEKVNLGHTSAYTSGSGKNWYGDFFRNQRDKEYNGIFNFPNLVTSDSVRVFSEFLARSESSSRFRLILNNSTTFQSNTISSTNLGGSESNYAHVGTIINRFLSNQDLIQVKLEYPATTFYSEGWLDYIEITARRRLQFNGNQFMFRDFKSLSSPYTTYSISGDTNGATVWDISNPLQAQEISLVNQGNAAVFHYESEDIRQFIIFNANNITLVPEPAGPVPNQNLHSIMSTDLLIIYHSELESEAHRLADFRRNHSGLEVTTVEISQVYNEFSGGSQDITAVRDFAKMIYDRDVSFNYLLLFGDATFDYKGILEYTGPRNWVPTWQSETSRDPVSSFPSDDYFALLDNNEGGSLRGAIDIAVGRIPVNSVNLAAAVVNKIIKYETDPSTLGDWRLNLSMAADDEDSNRHINDADKIATNISQKYKVFNIDKIYFDAYPQVSTPGGQRYPAAKNAINQNVFKGQLVLNYLGHGGATGLAQERVVEVGDINNWRNTEKMPLIVTATCTFSSFDDQTRVSAGEYALFNPTGGAIALFTTTRAVYAHHNERLTSSVFNTIFERRNGKFDRIGEVVRKAKNANSTDTSDTNARKFTLLGDPTLQLAIPFYDVRTTKINGKNVNPAQLDTIKALGKYTIEGEIVDANGQLLDWFNGKVIPTIYDKEVTLQTLGQDLGSGVRNFDIQQNVIFKGAASVTNGRFSFTFIVPKDINYAFGNGKISYYASNENLQDAGGFFKDFIVGGTSDNSELSTEGPTVQLFMNDENFVFGGITNNSPILVAKLQAPNGINVTGTAIGHDLSGILNEDEKNAFVLNNFYEGQLDDYTRGTVRYPLAKLEPGLYKIKVKAWDAVNKSGEGYLEFTVVNDEEFVIKNLLNYPNPFNRNTRIEFEHNHPFSPIDVQVQIYSVSGHLVKSIEQNIIPEGYLVRDIHWDGRDEYGQKLANGVYLYKMKVSMLGLDGSRKTTESEFQKMVILN